MSRLKWDKVGERYYKTGVDHGVLYPMVNNEYPKGVVWNGLTTVTESPSGAEDNPQYADNIKYLNLKSAEEFGLTIECLTYPDEWGECNGEMEPTPGLKIQQQRRKSFGFSYRTKVGNDTEGEDFGFEIHMVYGCSASPSEMTNNTINDSPEVGTFSYEVTTTPVAVSGLDANGKPYKPTAHAVVSSVKTSRAKIEKLEAILYGTDGTDTEDPTDGYLPLPDELIKLLSEDESEDPGTDPDPDQPGEDVTG